MPFNQCLHSSRAVFYCKTFLISHDMVTFRQAFKRKKHMGLAVFSSLCDEIALTLLSEDSMANGK